jgi:ArsR family transcriptional regulator
MPQHPYNSSKTCPMKPVWVSFCCSEMGELCVCDLCTALEQSQPKISRHLAMLRESGLLLDRKQGKWVHYRLSPHIPSWAAQVIEQAWLSQQDDVQAIARKLASANCSGSGKAVCI